MMRPATSEGEREKEKEKETRIMRPRNTPDDGRVPRAGWCRGGHGGGVGCSLFPCRVFPNVFPLKLCIYVNFKN